jgi:hypothetical protein
MADASITYNQAVQNIEDFAVERSVVFVIDPTNMFANSIRVGAFDYEKAYEIISATEGTRRERVEAVQQPVLKMPTIQPKEREEISASKEIAKIISSAGREFENKVAAEAVKIKKEKIILPTLSIQDQISDLEKMSEGIDENVFNEEQLDIIRLEAGGMDDRIKYEKQIPADEFQKSLVDLRNRRLQEVLSKLKAMHPDSAAKNN